MSAVEEFQKGKSLGLLLGPTNGSHDSLEGLENMGMKVRDLEERPTNNPLLPDRKEVSLAGGSGWSAREFSFHYDYY